MHKQLKPRDMFCFEQVAKVIGETLAEEELGKVIETWVEGLFSPDDLKSNPLMNAFDWSETPQGDDYWHRIWENDPFEVETKTVSSEDESGEQLKILYKNWKGITSERVIIPKEVVFQKSEWHGDKPVWLMIAEDVEKAEEREFKLEDIVKFL